MKHYLAIIALFLTLVNESFAQASLKYTPSGTSGTVIGLGGTLTFNGGLQISGSGTRFTSSNGVLSIASFGSGADEVLTIDGNTTPNVIVLGTTSGATALNLGSFNLTTSGTYEGDGSLLEQLNATNISAGTLAAARGGTGVSNTGTVTASANLTVSQATTLNRQSSTGLPVEFMVACSDVSSAITTGTKKGRFRAPYAFTVTEVRADVDTAPTGSTILIDINESGTTILSTKLMIDATEQTSQTAATPYVISDSAIADNAEITIDFDQVGSTIAGTWVILTIKGFR